MTKLLHHSVPVSSIPPAGKHFRIEAGDADRSELAAVMQIAAVESLVAELDVRPIGARDFVVEGTLTAIVVQTDVVTLDPVRKEVAERIELILKPAEETSKGEHLVDLSADDSDFYRRGRLDLGHIVSEHLALGLDPYPRSPENVFEGYVEDEPQASESPFAALSALKKDGD